MIETQQAVKPLVVVMGVSGCGKSTVGATLAERLGVHFIDGDSLHPLANIQKMAQGIPLEDSDRWPWLADVGRTLRDYDEDGLVIACSALKRSYRNVVRWEAPRTVFLHAHGPEALIRSRMRERAGHFMPAALLASQLDTLEPLDADENGFIVDITPSIQDVVESAVTALISTERSAWATANSYERVDDTGIHRSLWSGSRTQTETTGISR